MNPLIKARLQQHNTLINIINKKSGGKNSQAKQEPKQKKASTWSNMLIGNSKTEHSLEDNTTANASPSVTASSASAQGLEIK